MELINAKITSSIDGHPRILQLFREEGLFNESNDMYIKFEIINSKIDTHYDVDELKVYVYSKREIEKHIQIQTIIDVVMELEDAKGDIIKVIYIDYIIKKDKYYIAEISFILINNIEKI